MIFKSKIDWFFKTILIVLPLLAAIGFLSMLKDNETSKNEAYIFILVMSMLFLFILSLALKTHYIFDPTTLICRSGLIKKQIEYSEIKKVTTKTTLFVGLKLSLSIKGIVIHYGKYEEIFISPQEQEKFLEMLQEKNPTISIN